MAIAEVSPKLSKWQALQNATAEVAKKWSEDIELDGEPGTREIYMAMANKVIELALKYSFNWPDDWRKQVKEVANGRAGVGLHDGYRILALHTHHGCLMIGCNGIQRDILEPILRHPLSFKPLLAITKEKGEIAGRVETEHGLHKTSPYPDVQLIEKDRFSIEAGAVGMPRLEHEVINQKMNAMGLDSEAMTSADFSERNESRCRAQQAKVLEPIRHHIITIALKDFRLANASWKCGKCALQKPTSQKSFSIDVTRKPVSQPPQEVFLEAGFA